MMSVLTKSQSGIELTEEQRNAADMAIDFLKFNNGKLFRIGGYAGTGKTTIAKAIVAEVKAEPMVCAFTGKAAHVLRNKGLRTAGTIHRTIYKYNEFTGEFEKVRRPDGDYFLIDEGSMISSDLWDDVQSFGLPVILIGDPGQLEPVGNNPNLMANADVVLERIHRQAESSNIIQMANAVRHGWEIEPITGCDDLEILPRHAFFENLKWADQVLCGFNRTRVSANGFARSQKGFSEILEEGEKIVVLRNDRELGVFNGQMFNVDRIIKIGKREIIADLSDEAGDRRRRIPIWNGHFNQRKPIDFDYMKRIRNMVIADYGYAVTVHKFQGSEADRVLVMDEQCGVWDAKRWRYTAITRAAKELRYCL